VPIGAVMAVLMFPCRSPLNRIGMPMPLARSTTTLGWKIAAPDTGVRGPVCSRTTRIITGGLCEGTSNRLLHNQGPAATRQPRPCSVN
jgi:hypothetical protein